MYPKGRSRLSLRIWGELKMNKEMRKPDRRGRRTRRAICNAFIVVMTRKSFAEITVQDIADEADIHRKTFYYYYQGIHQVADEIETRLQKTFDRLISEIELQDMVNDPSVLLKKINTVMSRDPLFYSALFSLKDGAVLLPRAVEFFKEKTKKAFKEQLQGMDKRMADFLLDYMICGTIAVYVRWFQSINGKELNQITRAIGALALKGYNSVPSEFF